MKFQSRIALLIRSHGSVSKAYRYMTDHLSDYRQDEVTCMEVLMLTERAEKRAKKKSIEGRAQ
jgi:DNA polymerase elongation subunit (family B)